MKSKKATKRALLTSAMSLVLCFAMLLGSTYAWFTDTAETAVNTIQSGTLDVDLVDEAGDTLVGQKLQFVVNGNTGAPVDDDDILWEPGATFVSEGFQIVNLGNLWLKYQLVINGIDGDAKLLEAIDIYITDDPTSRNAVELGSYLGDLSPEDEGEDKSDVYYLVASMKEDAGNEYQGLAIEGVGITVYATQKDAESDSFGNDYDKTASVTVGSGDDADYASLAAAIAAVEDGGIVFVEPGVYNLSSGPIVIEGKTVSIIGVNNVTINKNYGNTHIFTVKNGANVTFENLHMDGQGNTREGIYVRWNSVVTLKNCTIENTGGSDIMIDEASDAEHGKNTASYVNLINTDIEDVAMCASPVTTVAATQDTYVYFNYDRNSSIGAIEVQSINLKPENIIINGVVSTEVGKTMNLYVTNDEELAAALETIKTDEEYWNKQVYIHMAAGEYSADHVINQYPQWNGVVGAGATDNNYATGVTGAPGTNVTFVGETASTYGLRSAATPAVVFTGKVTVNGFGNAGTGFGSTFAVTTFQNVAFDGANIEPDDGDVVALTLTAAADNIYFDNCAFLNTTHVVLGGSGATRINKVYFTGCMFEDAGSLSGYPLNVTIDGGSVDGADGGFLNIQNEGTVKVTGVTANVGRFFIRTSGSGVKLTVEDSDITVYESEGTKHLVWFRGSGHSAKFTDCTIADGYTTAGVGTNGTLAIGSYTEENGVTLYNDAITGEKVLYLVPADYAEDTVIVPEGVTTIGGYAFAHNSNIETIELPSTVTKLNDRAFRDTSASTVVLNEGLTNISYQAFRNATNVTSVEIPSTVTTISKEAFQHSGITTLTIPANVTTIEYGGCRDMKMLEHVVIEGNVEIPVYAFRACTNLKTVTLKGDNVTFAGRGMIFTNKEDGDGSAITVTVHNEEIKARLLAADTAATDYGGYTIICENIADENGIYTDGEGNTYAYASDNSDLSAAISGGADTVYLSSGTYTLPSAINGKTVTISGTKDTKVSVTNNLTYINGADVTFEGVTIQSKPNGYGYENGFADAKYATFNNCVIDGTLGLDFSCEFNGCTFNISGNYYNVWTWGAGTATFKGCTFNCDGKALLVYANVLDNGTTHQTVEITNCVFNDNGDDTVTGKAAIEITNTYTPVRTYDVKITNTKVNGFSQTVPGAGDFNAAYGSVAGSNIGTNVWGNKCELPNTQINVVIDGVDVY